MTNDEKIAKIKEFLGNSYREFEYYNLLEELGDLKQNYSDYMTSEPINCDFELRRLDNADYDLAAALLTMMLREDHFCEGSFERRLRSGQVDAVLIKMVDLLSHKDEPEQGIYIRKDIPLLQLGQIKRIRLISEAGGFGPPPEPDDEIEQHISICSDGRVYLSRYRFGNRMDFRNEKFFNEQFKISPSKANYILSLIGMYFESEYIDIFATDVGTWNLELINEKGERFHFSGSLCQDIIYRKEYVSRLIREFTDRADLFCFDGEFREKLEVGEDEFIFVEVYLDEYDHAYTYICDDNMIQEDDEVLVPFGAKNIQLVGGVTNVQVLPRDKAPYPIEKCKKVIERL